jgi:glutamate racemase
VALRWIQQQWLPVRRSDDGIARNVIGIVVPTIEVATEGDAQINRQSNTIAIFATRRTVETQCYPMEIRKRKPEMTVIQQACPELAGSIERGVARDELRALVNRYVGEMLDNVGTAPECVILGCTHYPLVADLFSAVLPKGVRMIHQPEATARALTVYLARHPEYDGSHSGERKFLSTGFPAEALPLIETFWGDKVPFVQA